MMKQTSKITPSRASKRKSVPPSSYVMGLTEATSVAELRTIPDLSAFYASSTPVRMLPSSNRWNLVTPSPRKRRTEVRTNGNGKPLSSELSSSSKGSTTGSSSEKTLSFGAYTAANFPALRGKDISIHTLILGTHPSVKSLEEAKYYGHQMNAFWWIAGDCLGFRRDTGISSSTGQPYKFSSLLRYDKIIPYEQQLELLCSKGFALWDIIESCHRPGSSLDKDITNDTPNDIYNFWKQHPSIRRIVITNGTSGCRFFKKHFGGWFDSGEIVPSKHAASQEIFSEWKNLDHNRATLSPVEIICAIAVSPAAARYSYKEKLKFWETYVYKPGLEDHMNLNKNIVKRKQKKKLVR